MACSITRFPDSGNFSTFVEQFLLRNEPCIFGESLTRDWRARKQWQREGRPDLEYLKGEFGGVTVPVADCSRKEFSSHPKLEMKFADYTDYWRSLSVDNRNQCEGPPPEESKLLYLKDWHFMRDFPEYGPYTLPDFFCSDWLNEVWDLRRDEHDDYRFVYMGPKGTWTPFHADVFRSYSWSANVCGQKEWLLYPPGQEELLRDSLGNLPFDVTSPELNDRAKFPSAHKAQKPIHVVQGAGEVIFVPSGWHHQVRNMEDTISINHNWTNAFSLQHMWNHLKAELKLVELEIADCKEMEGWTEQCQVILKASAGIDYKEFFQFLCLIALPRLREFELLTGRKSDDSDTCFSTLKYHISKALSSKTLSFFGHQWPKVGRDKVGVEKWAEMGGDEVSSENEILTSCSASLMAKDNLAAILDAYGCLQNCDESSIVPTQTTAPVDCPPLRLFHSLPAGMQEALRLMVPLSCPEYAHKFSTITFRAFELHHVWIVMEELLLSTVI